MVRGLVRGEPVAVTAPVLGAAFDAFGQAVFGFCLRRCADREAAEDLLSVVFLEAWRSRERAFAVDGSLAPWLFGIAGNVVRTAARSSRRRRAALYRYHARTTAQELVQDDHADAVVHAQGWPESQRVLAQAFATLSSKDQAVADLCLVQGLTPTVAAVALGLPVGTVKSRLAHARQGLQVVLRPGESAAVSDPGGTSGHEQGGRTQRVPGTRAVVSWRNQ